MDTATLLAEFARDRSEQAFNQIVSEHIDFVYSVALRQGCDAALAQDVAQIVFIKLAQHASRLRGNLPLDTWLFTVTRNAAINSIRQRDRRRQHEQKAAAMADSEVIIDAQDVPQVTGWQGHEEEDSLPGGNHKAHDLTMVLDHFTDQTGLAWQQEPRTVRHLFIEKK